jgi:hypothetical protein
MRLCLGLVCLFLLSGCSTSIGQGGLQMGFGSGAQQCDEALTCRVGCERQEVQ